jgi:hypothetical protein
MQGCNRAEGWPDGLIQRMFSRARSYPLALRTYTDKKTSDYRPHASKIPGRNPH